MNQPLHPKKLFFFAALFAVLLLIPASTPAAQTPAKGGCFIYPSPATGNFAWVVYNLPENGNASIYIYDEAGDLITQEQASNSAGIQQTPFDLTHYQRGIYICRVVLTLDSGVSQSLKLFKFIVSK
jgi:Secretion system C-terminal sorting domain